MLLNKETKSYIPHLVIFLYSSFFSILHLHCYIITEWFFLLIFFVNYILSFGLVGLWTIRLGAGAHIEYSSRSRAEDMTITNVIIKTPDWKWTGVWMTSCPEARIWWFQKRRELRFDSGQDQSSWGLRDARLLGQLVDSGPDNPEVSWDLTLGWAVQLGVGCGRCRNSQHRKNCVSLSPRVEKLNSRS